MGAGDRRFLNIEVVYWTINLVTKTFLNMILNSITLLITNNPNIIYYYYSIQFIKNINKYNINNNNNIKQIIISKIIIDLIKFYKGLEEFENNSEEIKTIEDYNIKVIGNNLNILNELNLNMSIKEIKSKTIEEIYIEIIIFL